MGFKEAKNVYLIPVINNNCDHCHIVFHVCVCIATSSCRAELTNAIVILNKLTVVP